MVFIKRKAYIAEILKPQGFLFTLRDTMSFFRASVKENEKEKENITPSSSEKSKGMLL